MDANGNGLLSVAELDKAIVTAWPEYDHTAGHGGASPPVLAAHRAADFSGDGFVDIHEFERLLQALVYFNNLWHRFEEIDSSGDRRLSAVEFAAGASHVGLSLSHKEAMAEFRAICNHTESGGEGSSGDVPATAAAAHFMPGRHVLFGAVVSGPLFCGVSCFRRAQAVRRARQPSVDDQWLVVGAQVTSARGARSATSTRAVRTSRSSRWVGARRVGGSRRPRRCSGY